MEGDERKEEMNKNSGVRKGEKRWEGRNIPAKPDLFIYSFIQFTAIKSNQKQHNDKRQYS